MRSWLCLVWVLPLSACYTPRVATPSDAAQVWRELSAESEALAEGGSTNPGEEGAPVELSAQDAVAWALRVHPEIQVAQARVLRAQAGEGAIPIAPDLEFRLTEFHMDEIQAGETALDLAARLRPGRPGIASGLQERALQATRAQEARLAALRLRVAQDIRLLHGRAKMADLRAGTLAGEAALRALVHTRTETLARGGSATELDRSLASLAALEAQDEVHEAEMDARQARAEIKAILGIPPSRRLELNRPAGGVVNPMEAPPAREEALQEALEQRPETREVAARLAQARADLWVEERKSWPWFTFLQASREIGPLDKTRSWGFALGVDVPVARWIGQAAGPAQAAVVLGTQEERSVVAQVAREVDEALAHLARAISRHQEIEEHLMPAIEEAQKRAQEAGRLGSPGSSEPLRLELSRLRAQRRALRAKEELIAAQIQLQAVLGRP